MFLQSHLLAYPLIWDILNQHRHLYFDKITNSQALYCTTSQRLVAHLGIDSILAIVRVTFFYNMLFARSVI